MPTPVSIAQLERMYLGGNPSVINVTPNIPTPTNPKPTGGFGNIRTPTTTNPVPQRNQAGGSKGFQQNSGLRNFGDNSYSPHPSYTKASPPITQIPPEQKQPTPNPPRNPTPVSPTPRNSNQISNGTTIGGGLGAGAIVGGLISGLSGGDPIEGAIRGGAFAGGSIAGGLLLGGLAVAAGLPTGGLGTALVLGLGSYGAGYLSSNLAGGIYNSAKRALGYKDPNQISDNNSQVFEKKINPGQTGTVANKYYEFHWWVSDRWGNRSGNLNSFANFLPPLQLHYRSFGAWGENLYGVSVSGSNTTTVGSITLSYLQDGSFRYSWIRADGTSQEADIAQGTQPGGVISNTVTNHITNNYNYQSSGRSNDTPPTLANKTPTINNPSKGNTPVDKSIDSSKPQNRSNAKSNSGLYGKIIKRQGWVGPGGSEWTLTRWENGLTTVENGNAKIPLDFTSGSELQRSLKLFNEMLDSGKNPNNQLNNNLNSTGKTYEKTIDGEQISSNNTPEIIPVSQENTSIINENTPNPTPNPNPIPDNSPNPTPNPVKNVANAQQKQGGNLVNNLVNPPNSAPVPESQQNQDYKALLEEQQKLTTMLALGTGATWLASQFTNLSSTVTNNQSPCQWPSDRATVLTNQQTTNTTLGVVSNTQLVGINSTVNATNSTVTAINTTTNTISSNLTGLINTVGTATSTATTTLFGFVTKAYKTLYLDRVYNAMSFLMQVHNTAMLSRNVGESLGYLISNSLSIFGIKDENDQPLDFGQILGNSIENFIKNLLGEDTYNGASMQWKRLSAIYSSIANVYDLILQNLAGIAEGIQIVGNYTGEIGNALKKGGVVLENAYEWMEDNFKIKTGRLSTIERINEGLESIENTASELTEVTEVWIEGRESITEINSQVNEIKEQIDTNITAKLEAENLAKSASESPAISNSDLITPEPD